MLKFFYTIHKKPALKSPRLLAFLLVASALFLYSCSGDSTSGVDSDELNEDQQIAVEYFKEIALGFEFGGASEITRKRNSDILIFTSGEQNSVLLSELGQVISDLNELISRDNIELKIVSDSAQSNMTVFLGSGDEFAQVHPPAAEFTDSNFGLFFVYWNGENVLTRSIMYVDTERPTITEQRHLLREELTQSLGLAKDSFRFSDSIFQQNFSTKVTEYNKFDKAIIQMLYHPGITPGLNAEQADPILREIVKEVID